VIILDASILIAHLETGDSQHARATGLLLDHCEEDFAASAVTLAEILVGAIRAGRGDHARDALAELQVQAIGLDAGAGWDLAQLRVRTGLKLPDCCVLYVARIHAPAKVATFDTRLAAGAATLGMDTVAA
jgi:predicted nucleic acid-binding protein